MIENNDKPKDYGHAILKAAYEIANKFSTEYVFPEHVLIVLLNDPSIINLLAKQNISANKIEEDVISLLEKSRFL